MTSSEAAKAVGSAEAERCGETRPYWLKAVRHQWPWGQLKPMLTSSLCCLGRRLKSRPQERWGQPTSRLVSRWGCRGRILTNSEAAKVLGSAKVNSDE